MDFSRSSSSQPAATSRVPAMGDGGSKKNGAWRSSPKWLRIIWIVLLFAGTILVISVVALLYMGGNKENKLVDKSNFQAVFLTNGQVYFGNVVSANSKFIDIKNIYYLSVANQQVQPKDSQQNTSILLQKLGCELHGPTDEMVINRDQVTFWENLRTDGQVSKKIDEWVKQNPEGQKCTTPSAQLPVSVLGKDS